MKPLSAKQFCKAWRSGERLAYREIRIARNKLIVDLIHVMQKIVSKDTQKEHKP
jgi:hypothetical protein